MALSSRRNLKQNCEKIWANSLFVDAVRRKPPVFKNFKKTWCLIAAAYDIYALNFSSDHRTLSGIILFSEDYTMVIQLNKKNN